MKPGIEMKFKKECFLLIVFPIFILLFAGCKNRHSNLVVKQDNITQNEDTPQKFNVNFFLENSGSMNGYMEGPNTTFKNQLYSLLTRVKLLSNTHLNLWLINKGEKELYPDAGNDDLQKFKDILNPTSFRDLTKGDSLGETDLNNLIKRCIKKVDDKNVSIFVSDCIYSPGKNVKDATKYLADQKNGIFLNTATELKNKDLSIIILNCVADFKGNYWDRSDNKITFSKPVNRPYYIWIIGMTNHINAIIQSNILEHIDGGYSQKIAFQRINKNSTPEFDIIPNSGAGKFRLKQGEKDLVNNAVKSNNSLDKGLFGFAIAVDFSKSIHDKSFYLDSNNYTIKGGNFHWLKIEPLTNQPPFTHLLNFQTNELIDDSLQINVIEKIPLWVSQISTPDDSRMLYDSNLRKKTFGFEPLIEGLSAAFNTSNGQNTIGSIKIKICKEHTHINSGFLIIFLVVAVAFLIFFIIKKSR